MVASGALSISNAVPMVMGANIGTTVTNTLVSFGMATRRGDFQRAFSAAMMHDSFNIIAVLIFLPLEILFHPLEKVAHLLTGALVGFSGGEFQSPVKIITKPLIDLLAGVMKSELHLGEKVTGALMIAISLVLIFLSLLFLVKMLRTMLARKIENAIDVIVGNSGLMGIFIGFIITSIVQSSSVTTSIIVPLVAAQVMSLEMGFSITLGANVGTTTTALIASLAGGPAGLTIALVHLLFNISGILVIYPLPALRQVPLYFARKLAGAAAKSPIYAFLYVFLIFFVLPGILIIFDKLIS
jgi:sodium-dependent phosphate cotransporter